MSNADLTAQLMHMLRTCQAGLTNAKTTFMRGNIEKLPRSIDDWYIRRIALGRTTSVIITSYLKEHVKQDIRAKIPTLR
jgi:hypothetical protein